jgi:hypothetical protein
MHMYAVHCGVGLSKRAKLLIKLATSAVFFILKCNQRTISCAARQRRVDAAHLDQLLPIPAVAGKARDLARGNGADLTEVYLGHHPLEAGALDGASGGTVRIPAKSPRHSEMISPRGLAIFLGLLRPATAGCSF